MLKFLKKGAKLAGVFAGAAIFAAAQGAIARPGTVNYLEGQVNIDGQTLGRTAIGKTEVNPGDVLRTDNGKAEMLLTPGVFLRIGDHSAVRMLSPGIVNTKVQLLKGEALIEVAQLYKQNRLDVVDNDIDTQLLKKGLYRFNADEPQVAVLDGQARIEDDGQTVDVKKGKEVPLTTGVLKPEKFDRKAAEKTDPLYAWSDVRSQYLSAANVATAQTVMVNGPGWIGSGWYWNPWWDTWSFMPGSGLLYSPFGWGFYSPGYVTYAPPIYAYGGYRGYRGIPRYYGRQPGFSSRPGGVGMGRSGAGRASAPATAPAAPSQLPANGVHFGGIGGHRR